MGNILHTQGRDERGMKREEKEEERRGEEKRKVNIKKEIGKNKWKKGRIKRHGSLLETYEPTLIWGWEKFRVLLNIKKNKSLNMKRFIFFIFFGGGGVQFYHMHGHKIDGRTMYICIYMYIY